MKMYIFSYSLRSKQTTMRTRQAYLDMPHGARRLQNQLLGHWSRRHVWVTLRKAWTLLQHVSKMVRHHVEEEVVGSPCLDTSRQARLLPHGYRTEESVRFPSAAQPSEVHRCKGAPLGLQGVCISSYENMFRHSSEYVFTRWPHLTRPWPWPVLSISLLLTRHLRPPFSGILAEFGLAVISGLVSVANNRKSQLWNLTCPWPDIWPY